VEAVLLILDSLVLLIALYLGLRDDQRPPGAPQKSLFRTFDHDAVKYSALRQRRHQIVKVRIR
jgi:hypothetical protein